VNGAAAAAAGRSDFSRCPAPPSPFGSARRR
jgi:hypothetical protein